MLTYGVDSIQRLCNTVILHYYAFFCHPCYGTVLLPVHTATLSGSDLYFSANCSLQTCLTHGRVCLWLKRLLVTTAAWLNIQPLIDYAA